MRLIAVLAFAAARAHAADEGEACTVTTDCESPTADALHCIDGRCVSLRTKKQMWSPKTYGAAVMFGDGRGYTDAIIGVDIFALVGTTSLLLAAQGTDASYRGGWQAAAMVPFVLGPTIHASRGRWGAAIVSFFGWSSVGLTVLTASLLTSSCDDCASGWSAAGAGVLLIGGSLMTWLDAWMARDVRAPRQRSSWFPVVAPARQGATLGVSGLF